MADTPFPRQAVLEVAHVDVKPGETEGFRGSPGYQEWKRLLHRFYDPFPTVEHYRRLPDPG